jgi:hypothetical protein
VEQPQRLTHHAIFAVGIVGLCRQALMHSRALMLPEPSWIIHRSTANMAFKTAGQLHVEDINVSLRGRDS